MSAIKEEIKAVFRGELNQLAVPRNGVLTVKLISEVVKNDNLLQELENVVHTYSKPSMEADATIKKLEERIAYVEGDKAELLKIYHTEEAYNKELMERNKRLSKANIELQKGIMRGLKEETRCDHVEIKHGKNGVKVKNLVKTVQVEKGIYAVKCTKCGKQF